MPTESTTPANPHWLAYFEELFRLSLKLDALEAERAVEQAEAPK